MTNFDQNTKYFREAEEAGLLLKGDGRNKSYRTYEFRACGHAQEIKPCHVRVGNFRCNTCLLEKLQQEAEAVGLILIGDGKNCAFKTYKFKECGHTQEIQASFVRRSKSIRCQSCLSERLEQEADAVGLILKGKGKNKNYRTYECKTCGHTQELKPNHVRDDNFRCNKCLLDKLKQEAEAVGLTLIGLGERKNYKEYKFKDCGHMQELSPARVRDNQFRCQTCLSDRLKQEAEKVGLILIGEAKEKAKGYRTYEFKNCGHTQVIDIGCVRNNSFICQTCEDTSFSQPSNIYLIKISNDGKSWLKLGYAKVVNNRYKEYGLPNSALIEEVLVVPIATGKAARELELEIHKRYKKDQLSKRLTKSMGMSISGFGECYPIDMKETLFNCVMGLA
ncbi:hypothetical protein AAEU32_00355 [Pseudoalteromonas sp. SSDWG2]|uniref:hypothetical protein n=1 Tax=Pseudoalteromonas sp. SSDWG2 TaxID=3139391 RepID=UPI003BAAFC96